VPDITSNTSIIFPSDFARALQPSVTGQLGNADVFHMLLPKLDGDSTKKQQPLQKVDHYMLEETHELYSRLSRFCEQLQISRDTEFKVARRGNQLQIIGQFNHRDMLNQMINADLWFVDSFKWLQPNYSSLAHSFELVEFSQQYEQSPGEAIRRYSHFDLADKGLAFALKYAGGAVNAQVESPLNLYQV
jgi:hypothetical protein